MWVTESCYNTWIIISDGKVVVLLPDIHSTNTIYNKTFLSVHINEVISATVFVFYKKKVKTNESHDMLKKNSRLNKMTWPLPTLLNSLSLPAYKMWIILITLNGDWRVRNSGKRTMQGLQALSHDLLILLNPFLELKKKSVSNKNRAVMRVVFVLYRVWHLKTRL